MQYKSILTIGCIFSLAAFTIPAGAEQPDAASACIEWRGSVAVDMDKLDKLRIIAKNERPQNGQSQTKNQFIVLLGKNLVAARDTLANAKEKLPKTKEGKVDLKDVNLSGLNLSGVNFDNVDLTGTELNGADLSGSTFRDALLYKTELEGANLNYANFSFANLSSAKLNNASLCGANFASAQLEDVAFKGAYLKGAKLDHGKNLPKSIYMNVQGILQYGMSVPADN
ncbi:MAG: pentapeptide repeat-containing protein [Gallionellaceae bacterium]